MAVGLAVLLIGFMLMAGGAAESPSEFTTEVFSARRITVAPITCLVGYAIVMWAIFKRPKNEAPAETQE